MKESLSAEAVVSFNSEQIGFSHLSSGHEITLTGWHKPHTAESKKDFWLDLQSGLPAKTLTELIQALRENDLLTKENVEEQILPISFLPAQTVVSLTSALINPAGLNEKRLFLIHRQQEILILPFGTTDLIGKEAFRLFVSGILPLFLRSAYAFGVLSSQVTVFGDECVLNDLADLRKQFAAYQGEPLVVSPSGEVRAKWRELPGRLHPVQKIITQKLELSGETVLYRHGAEYACPDLRFCELESGWWAWGHDKVESFSQFKAAAEAVERYAAGTVAYNRLVWAKAGELSFPHLDPRRIINYTDEQLSRHADWRKFNENEKRFWILGETERGEAVYVLADLVFNPFVPPIEDQRVHCRANSSGVAFGNDADGAKLRARLECIERDAFLRIWYSRESPPRIDSESVSTFGRSCLKILRGKKWKTSLLCLNTQIPVIAAIARKKNAILIGCAVGEPSAAVDKALSEISVAISGLTNLQKLLPEEMKKAEDHTMLYRQKGISAIADFLTESREVVDLRGIKFDNIQPPEDELYFVRLPEVTGETEHVWRCLSPNLIPMTFGYDSEPRGRSDVQNMIERAVRNGHELFYYNDALCPHPFA